MPSFVQLTLADLLDKVSPKPKQQLLSIIDTFIAAEQNRRGSST